MGLIKLKNEEVDTKKKARPKRESKIVKMNTLEFYTELLFSLVGRGDIDKPDEETVIGEGYFYYATNKIFTKDKIKKVLFITELPMELDKKFLKNIKMDTRGLGEISVIKRFEPYTYNPNSWGVRSRTEIWKKRLDQHNSKVNNMSESDEIFSNDEDKESDRRTRWMINSWKWLNSSRRNKDNLCKFQIVLELTADNLNRLYEMERLVKENLRLIEVENRQIFVQTNEYYKAFNPAGNVEDNMLNKMHTGNVLSDRVASEMFDVAHGISGDETGLYFGSNVFTSLPLVYNVKEGSDAINFILTASTGEGKSNYAKGLMTYFEVENLYSINIDYEGDEYTNVGIAHNAVFINMSPEASSYFDTVEIGDLTGDDKIDVGLKNEAISTTKLVFDVLTDYEKGMNFEEKSLYNHMINRVYKKREVTEDSNTWVNSKGASFKDLYNELKVMKTEPDFEERKNEITKFITKLEIYFEEWGMYKDVFKNKLSVNQILGNKRVIFSFGMRGKTENTIDKSALALRQLFVGYLVMLIANYNKTVLGKSTAVLLEELQRYLNHEASGQMVNDIVSGGRKRNMITFLITNSPLQIMDKIDDNDTSELSKHMKAIKGNIKGFIIGRLDDQTSTRITEAFPQLHDCLPEMKLINKDDDFKYCFLMHYRGENSIVKFEIPPKLRNSILYKTREDQKD